MRLGKQQGGGVPVHVLEWIDVAMGWADAYEKIYKIKKVDGDVVVAALVLHGWAKVWYEWDPNAAKVDAAKRPIMSGLQDSSAYEVK